MGKLWAGLILLTLVALVGLAIDPATLPISEAQPPDQQVTQEAPAIQLSALARVEMTPAEEVTQKFYDWYVSAVQARKSNPLADGAYRSSPYLSAGLVRDLDGILASFGDGPRYDPVLFASSVPRIVSVRTESLALGEARVTVRESWPNAFQDILARLEPVNGQWKLTELTRPVIDTRDNGTPRQAVRVFYNWYTEYARRVGNPLSDRAYQGDVLTRALQARMETARLSMTRWPEDDPILLGRDLSAGFDVDLDDQDGETAAVWVRDNSGSAEALYVKVQRSDDGHWVISDVAANPAG